jgi:hypothetical protein
MQHSLQQARVTIQGEEKKHCPIIFPIPVFSVCFAEVEGYRVALKSIRLLDVAFWISLCTTDCHPANDT